MLVSRNNETETHFHFHVHLLPKQKHVSISVVRESETERRFCFCLSVVNSAKNDPAKMGQAKLPATGRFARGQKKGISVVKTGYRNVGILFFHLRANLPGFCLLVICFGGSHGQIHGQKKRMPQAKPGQKKGCHGLSPGKKKGFITTAPHSFLFHHCHLLPSTPPPPSAVEPSPLVRRCP